MEEIIFSHRPVLPDECIAALNIRPDGVYLDATLGRAGHALEIAKRLTTGRLLCIDRDAAALEAAPEQLAGHMDKVTLLRGNFADLDSLLTAAGVTLCDGMLFDLGTSSPQLDDASRGFSYRFDAPLDMRMDQNDRLTAYEIVNTWPRDELRRILYAYGEERYAPLIAAGIERARAEAPIQTTHALTDIIRRAMPAAALREKQHPAKRTFQALRIAVNDELAAIERAMDAAVTRLAPSGRIAVISFHSLEDRIVKTAFARFAKGCDCPPDFPVCVCGKTPSVRLITKKPIVADARQVEENPRARSAKLRVAEKV